MQMPKTGFGAKVQALLDEAGLKPFRAQTLLGATDSTIINWIEGRALPPSPRLPSLASALGIPLPDLQAMVARERAARKRKAKRAAKMVGGRGHYVLSCPQRPKAGRS